VTPYYEHGGTALYLGDCREVLPALGVVADVVTADPPYGETSLVWDKRVAGWIEVARGLLAPSGSLWCCGSLRMFMATAHTFGGLRLAQDVVWEKHNGSSFHADRFKRVHELVAHWYRSDASWEDVYRSPQTTPDATARSKRRKTQPVHMGDIGESSCAAVDGGPRLMRSVMRVRSTHGYAVHPTQKPEPLMRPLIEYSCPPGGLVVSPFAGSGTDLVVAKLTGRRAIGCDTDERSCEEAANRLCATLSFAEGA
jgi:site-specific DNA-methyltransferase (adenine-specific)